MQFHGQRKYLKRFLASTVFGRVESPLLRDGSAAVSARVTVLFASGVYHLYTCVHAKVADIIADRFPQPTLYAGSMFHLEIASQISSLFRRERYRDTREIMEVLALQK